MTKQASSPTQLDPGSSSQGPVDFGRSAKRKKKGESAGGKKFELKLTSMIDVVFLLLIFFVITASFTVDEGTLLATMPGTTKGIDPPPPLVRIDLTSADDGITYSLQVNGQRIDNASALADYMNNRVQAGQMAKDDLVQITPQGEVRWQHVVNVYNACVNAELEQVAFAPHQ